MNCRECGADLTECAYCKMNDCRRALCGADAKALAEAWAGRRE